MLKKLGMAYYYQGMMLAQDNRITTAIDSLENSIVLNPENWKALNGLGLCLYQLGEFPRAKKAWLESVEEHGEGNPARGYLTELESPELFSMTNCYNKAVAQGSKGDYRRSLKTLKGFEGKEVQFVSFLNLMGLYYYGAGRRGKAVSLWEKAMALDRDNPRTQNYVQGFKDKHPLTFLLDKFWINLARVFLFHGKKEIDDEELL